MAQAKAEDMDIADYINPGLMTPLLLSIVGDCSDCATLSVHDELPFGNLGNFPADICYSPSSAFTSFPQILMNWPEVRCLHGLT